MANCERVCLSCCRLLVPVLLALAASGGWSQQLDVKELDTTAGRSFRFLSYTGSPPVVESVRQITGIGEVLNSRGDYYGKYTVIRAFQPSDTALLSADILVFGPGAQVNDIRNVQRIVAGYLAAAFGYDPGNANELAVLITRYNAAYRGDIPALSRKYTPLVMSHLTAESAGIALDYAQWPGKTRLIVPLQHAAGAQAATAPAGPAAAAGPAAGSPSPSAGRTPAAGAAPGARAAPGGQAAPEGQRAGGAAAPDGTSTSGGNTPAASTGAPGNNVPGGTAPGATAPGGTSPARKTGAPGAAAAVEGGAPATSGTGPASGSSPAAGTSPRRQGFFGINPYWLLAFAALLVLALLVFLFVRLGARLLRPSYDSELRRSVREGHPLVEMVVIPQNRHIGYRNVHYVRPGGSASVGGGRSRFLVYFVQVPPRMAVLRYDGERYSFEPVKRDLFPGLSGPVSDCMGKDIPARSARGYRFTILFRKFVPPLEEINRLMRSIRAGAPRGPAPR